MSRGLVKWPAEIGRGKFNVETPRCVHMHRDEDLSGRFGLFHVVHTHSILEHKLARGHIEEHGRGHTIDGHRVDSTEQMHELRYHLERDVVVEIRVPVGPRLHVTIGRLEYVLALVGVERRATIVRVDRKRAHAELGEKRGPVAERERVESNRVEAGFELNTIAEYAIERRVCAVLVERILGELKQPAVVVPG